MQKPSILTLREKIFTTYIFVQLFYAAREIWWGVSANYLHSNLHQLDALVQKIAPSSLIVLGTVGVIGALGDNYLCSLIYSFLNVFIFSAIALIFFVYSPESSGGGNYTIEAIGAIWLAFQVASRKPQDNKNHSSSQV